MAVHEVRFLAILRRYVNKLVDEKIEFKSPCFPTAQRNAALTILTHQITVDILSWQAVLLFNMASI